MGQAILLLVAGTLVTLLLQVAAGLLGPAAFFLAIFTPLPAAYAVMRRGIVTGGGVVLLTAALLPLVGSPGAAAVYLLQYGIGSLVLPLLLRRGWAWDRSIAASLGAVGILALLTLLGFSASRGVALPEVVSTYIEAEVSSAVALYQEAELPPEQLAEFQAVAETMGEFLALAWPGLAFVVTGAVLLVAVFFLSSGFGGRFEVPGPLFRQWKAPEHLIWLLIAGGGGMLFDGDIVRQVALNVLTVVLPIYFLQGLAIVTWWFRKRNVSPFIRNLGYVLVFILNPLPLVVTGVGVFDMWIDFRKPRIDKKA